MFDLKAFRKSVGVSQQELADLFGCGQSNISMIEKTGRNLEPNQIESLVSKYGQEAVNKFNFSTETKIFEDFSLVPLINIDSVGGMHSHNALSNSEQFTERLIPFTGAKPGDRAIYQSGDSMSPTIPPGSIMQIRKVEDWQEYFGYGNTFVLWLRDDRRITKQILKYSPDPHNFVTCHSFNPDSADEELPKKMIREVWKVIKVLTDKGW